MRQFNQQHAISALVAVLFLPVSLRAEVLVVTAARAASISVDQQQLSDLFTGRAVWIPGVPVAVPIDQPESSALREEFYSKVANKSASQVKAGWTRLYFTGRGTPPKEGADSDEVKKILNATPGTIGYIDRASLDASVRVLYLAQ